MIAFFDTNIMVYGFDDSPRGRIARGLLAQGGRIAVQSLNELALVLRRRYGMNIAAVRAEVARVAQTYADPVPLTLDIHQAGIDLVERHQLQIYDSMLLAAALQAGCTIFFSEDMADGVVIDGRLTIRNPFA